MFTKSQSPLFDAVTSPASVSSTLVARNGVMPVMHVQWRHCFGGDNFFGVLIEGQRLRPRLKTGTTPAFAEHDSAFTECLAGAYVRVGSDCAVLKAKAMFVQDGSELGLISGYAVEEMAPVSHKQKYTPTRSVAAWVDLDLWPDQKWVPGGVVAFAKNLGAGKRLYVNPSTGSPVVYGLGPVSGAASTIDIVFKVAPRLWIKRAVVEVGLEIDWTQARYGTIDEYGAVQNAVPVNNVRFQLSIFYKF
ncbi:TPA: hypothetical protein DDZ86_01310 [Candidatus Dependentiae bacterium]|nr:MAG: hypothetical protein UW09_C0004G0143 [candidate division TM6 bacterium GW2011_GWF2_43_87]HBL98264.1 hypothetical protein [Candidatus Dependentiae bacterium]